MIASIPSPSFNSIDIGPLSLNLYGLMIALGVIAAVWLFGKRLEERNAGTRDDASAIALWAVLAGIIGARLYHVVTDWEKFSDDLGAIPAIWEGGLGIPGGLLFGIAVGLYMARRRGIALSVAATCAAPAIPLAQAIGRWGNYFNQELYGRATDLPWSLEIDADHLEAGYEVGTTFHPTFLYESLWTLGLCLVLLWIDRRWRPKNGQLMVMYVIGYGIGRFWVEGLRIDSADELGGLRWNQWVALAAVVAGTALLIWMRTRPGGSEPDEFPLAPRGPDHTADPDAVEPDGDAADPDAVEPDGDVAGADAVKSAGDTAAADAAEPGDDDADQSDDEAVESETS